MLNVDEFFYKVLSSDTELKAMVDDRIFNSARDKEADKEDKIPYIIITYEGGTAGEGDKDTRLTPLEHATVSIICCANDREDLADLTDKVEEIISEAFEDYDEYDSDDWKFVIDNASYEAKEVMYDIDRPCYAQQLYFYCDTSRKE